MNSFTKIDFWGLILVGIVCAGFMLMLFAGIVSKSDKENLSKQPEVATDTVIQIKYIPVEVPVIEIPHTLHGRVIVDLNDSTITLTADRIIINEFHSQEQLNQYLYQEFGGRYINRKGK